MLEPMNLREAIEAMKIVNRYADEIKAETNPRRMVARLLKKINEVRPTDSLALVALMHHCSIEAAAEQLRVLGGRGLVKALVEGFVANAIPDLANAAAVLGIAEKGW